MHYHQKGFHSTLVFSLLSPNDFIPILKFDDIWNPRNKSRFGILSLVKLRHWKQNLKCCGRTFLVTYLVVDSIQW